MQKSLITRFSITPYLFWAGYWLLWVLMLSNFQELEKALWGSTVNVTIQAVVVYSNILYLIPRYLEKRSYLAYICLAIVLLIILCRLHISLVQPELKVVLKREIRFPRAFQFGRIYLLLVIVLIISTAYKFAIDRFQTLQRQTELSRHQLESELQFLKSQINPHFLFNTLNNIYTLTYLKDENAAPMILKLSELLRYMLYECQGNQVSLEKEVDFVQNIVQMQKLKSETYEYRIAFECSGIHSRDQIAPLLLLVFLENSFKHSDLDTNPTGEIRLFLNVSEKGELSFICFNTKRQNLGNQVESSGIGLVNVQKRLELIYPQAHTLEIHETDDTFEIRLTLILQ